MRLQKRLGCGFEGETVAGLMFRPLLTCGDGCAPAPSCPDTVLLVASRAAPQATKPLQRKRPRSLRNLLTLSVRGYVFLYSASQHRASGFDRPSTE